MTNVSNGQSFIVQRSVFSAQVDACLAVDHLESIIGNDAYRQRPQPMCRVLGNLSLEWRRYFVARVRNAMVRLVKMACYHASTTVGVQCAWGGLEV